MTPPAALTLPRSFLLRKLGRTTSNGTFIPEIDGLRCLAIGLVVAFHLARYVAEKSPHPFTQSRFDDLFFQLLRTGHIGVQLFFVISGFVVAMPFASHYLCGEKKVDLRRYFLRRLTRIEPPYVIALIFWLLAFGVSGLGDAPWRVVLRHFPASLFYVHNLAYGQPSYVMPPAWSLEIEVQFYILAPLLVGVFCIRPSWVRRSIHLTAIFAIAFAQRWLRTPGQINGLHLDQEAHYFLAGMLLVDLYVTGWGMNQSARPWIADSLAMFCFVGLSKTVAGIAPNQLLIVLLLLIFVGAALRSNLWLGALRNPWIYTFGGMCYTTYLYHGFFKALPGHFTIQWQIGHAFWLNFLLQACLLGPIIVAGSAALFLLTEKPFMNRRQKTTYNADISANRF